MRVLHFFQLAERLVQMMMGAQLLRLIKEQTLFAQQIMQQGILVPVAQMNIFIIS
jgi:hypothetical protein